MKENKKVFPYLCCFSIFFFKESGIPLIKNCFRASTASGSSLGLGVALVNTGATLTGFVGSFVLIESSSEHTMTSSVFITFDFPFFCETIISP